MKVLIYRTAQEAKTQAAHRILSAVHREPEVVLGLATGGTMEGVYAALVAGSRQHDTSWAKVTTFNLDEYWGISPDDPASYRRYMNHHLFYHIDIDLSQTHVPLADGADPQKAAQAYDAVIREVGGIDLQLLGIGVNGHIGFNEPTSSLSSRTRLKTLTQSTREANRRFFRTIDEVPKYALTVGIGTILEASECLLVATGDNKAAAVWSMIEGAVSAACPASALQMHAQVTVMLDAAAAKDLKLRSYYQLVHPDGQESALNDV